MNIPATGTVSVEGATLYYERRGSGPPLLRLLPDAAQARAFIDDVHETYLRAGVGRAMGKFAAGIGMDSPVSQGHPGLADGGELPAGAAAMIGRMNATIDRMHANAGFFLAHELRQFSSFVPDIDALQAVRDRVILATGRDSAALLPGRPAAVLTGRLGSKVAAFPGGHAGYATDPADFAVRLAGVLAGGFSADAFSADARSAAACSAGGRP
jgi:hypothetical protein